MQENQEETKKNDEANERQNKTMSITFKRHY